MTPEQVRITPLEWSDEREPCEDCRYNHVVADSGLGFIRIEWKGWKEFDSFTVYGVDAYIGNSDTLEGAKLMAEKYIRQVVITLIEPPLAMQAQQVAVPAWMPAATQMPEPCTNVLAYNGKKQPIRAQWVPEKTLEDNGDGDFGEYDEATNAYYWPAAWYETNDHEETHWMVDEPVTHWMPLPQPPQGDKA